MKFIKTSVPDIRVIPNHDKPAFNIDSMQYLDETDDRVYLKCAEYVGEFKRGFVCDLITYYDTVNSDREDKESHSDTIRDLVLVYVNKTYDIEFRPVFEYIFFK